MDLAGHCRRLLQVELPYEIHRPGKTTRLYAASPDGHIFYILAQAGRYTLRVLGPQDSISREVSSEDALAPTELDALEQAVLGPWYPHWCSPGTGRPDVVIMFWNNWVLGREFKATDHRPMAGVFVPYDRKTPPGIYVDPNPNTLNLKGFAQLVGDRRLVTASSSSPPALSWVHNDAIALIERAGKQYALGREEDWPKLLLTVKDWPQLG